MVSYAIIKIFTQIDGDTKEALALLIKPYIVKAFYTPKNYLVLITEESNFNKIADILDLFDINYTSIKVECEQ